MDLRKEISFLSDNFQAHAEQTRSIPTIFIAVKLNFHKSDNSLISETNLIDGLAEVNRRGNQIFHKAILSWATRELKVSCDSRFRNGIFFSRNFFLSLAKPLTAVYDRDRIISSLMQSDKWQQIYAPKVFK